MSPPPLYASHPTPTPPSTPSPLNKPKHTKYFLRCLKTFLPPAYTSNDSNRLSLAFFTVAGLDLLDALEGNTTAEERGGYVDWIYRLQLPGGGFRAFPGTDLGEWGGRRDGHGHGHEHEHEHERGERGSHGDREGEGERESESEEEGKAQDWDEERYRWDPANLPATYFALATLLILGDDLSRVRRKQCLEWLPRLQRPDGSFGETLVQGKVEGGTDPRFGYCAAGVRFVLRGGEEGGLRDSGLEGVRDVDVEALVRCIRRAETYDGGISDKPFHEAHAGFTFCAIGALSFLNRLSPSASPANSTSGLTNPSLTLHWLLSRQTATITLSDDTQTHSDETDTSETCHDAHTFVHPSSFPSKQGRRMYEDRDRRDNEGGRGDGGRFDVEWTGFNGRENKVADTCYAFWVGGALDMLGHSSLIHHPSTRAWLLDRTAHPHLGGFGKHAADLPDVYHSYLGLAALSLLGGGDAEGTEKASGDGEGREARGEGRENGDGRSKEEEGLKLTKDGLKPLDATMCISKQARGRLRGIWKRWESESESESSG